jgi:hypothetical protein
MRRAIGVAATILLALGGAILILLWFENRDNSQVSQQTGGAEMVAGPGRLLPDQGDAHLRPGQRPAAAYVTDPPASGAHVPAALVHDATRLSDDQLLHALELGDVVLVYGGARPPAALRALADRVAGPFDPALAAAGQAVVLARRPGTRGVIALAWRHELRVPRASDPALAPFADFWLGRGAPS